MRKKRKVYAILLSALLLFTFFGCGPKKVEEDNQGVQLDGSITEEQLELSIHLHLWNTVVFDDDWPVFDEAARMTNIKLKGTASKSATDSNQVFNIMMASGVLPDIIHTQRIRANQYGIEGAFIPLNDLIEEHAPNIMAMFEEMPDARRHVTAPDGNIYSISFIADGEAAMGYFIRKDWLNKLNLEVPQNVDQLYNTLKAFRERDPNESGSKDEVPFFARNAAEAIRFVNLFGAKTGWYVENDKVRYGQYEEPFREGIINVSKWYSEGLIDQEIFTRGSSSRDELLTNNRGGMTHDWFGSTAVYNDTLSESIPGFDFAAIAPPADVNGKVWEETSRALLSDNVWGISYLNEHPVETIKYFDFWFSEEGRRLMNFGIEDVHYTIVDGKPIFKDEILNGDEPVLALLNNDGAQIEIGFQQDFFYEEQWMTPSAKQGISMYVDNNYIVPAFPSLSFTEEERKVLENRWTSIRTYMEETRQKWILGAESPETGFDNYLSGLREMGIEEVIAVYQSAYDRYMSE